MTTQVPFFDLKRINQELLPETSTAVKRVLASGNFVGGEEVQSFENSWARKIGVDEFIGVGNGLDAIRILLEAFGIGEGDEVIVPGFTYYATWLGVVQAGAIPVAVDVELGTANIDPTAVEVAISSKTKAILVVHLFGQVANLPAIQEIASRHNLFVFEDVAQAHLQATPGGITGATTDGGAFSFYPTKNLGAVGDAGGIATNNEIAAQRMRSLRSYGQGTSKYDHVSLGWNSRLDPIQAALLNVYLLHLEEWTSRRRKIAAEYLDAVAGTPLENKTLGPADVFGSVWHHFVLSVERRDEFRAYFADSGIATDIHYPYFFNDLSPLEKYRRNDFDLSNSEVLAQSVVSLPMGPWMNDYEVKRVADCLRAFQI